MSEAKKSILVVDDDRTVVEFLSESLAERGFEVAGAVSGPEALDQMTRRPFDLVVTDVEMPGMRGTDLCAAILADHPTQLVILITAFGTIELAVSAVRTGAADFVAKPFKIEALVFAIERAFRDRQMRREIVRLKGAVTAPFSAASRSRRATVSCTRCRLRSTSPHSSTLIAVQADVIASSALCASSSMSTLLNLDARRLKYCVLLAVPIEIAQYADRNDKDSDNEAAHGDLLNFNDQRQRSRFGCVAG